METTRRRFLGGLAVASALSGIAATNAVASSSVENPDLLKLGADFDAANARFTALADWLPASQEAYRAIAPVIPEDLIAPRCGYAWRRGFADFWTDPSDPDNARIKDANGTPIEIIHAYRIESAYGATFERRSPATADFTDASEMDMYLYHTAQAFEADVEAALNASGLKVEIDEYQNAQAALRSVIFALCAVRAKTPVGVGLKVRATAAYAAFGPDERFTASNLLARAVWEDMREDA